MPHVPRLALALVALLALVPAARAQEPGAPATAAAAPAPAAADARPPEPVTPARLRMLLHGADRLLLERRFVEALEPLRKVTEVVPSHAGAWLLTSKALSGAGRPVDAVEAAERAVALLEREPPDRRAAWLPGPFYLQLGKARAVAGDLAGAERALRSAAAEQAPEADTARELGSVLLRLGRDADAVEILRRAAALDPASARSGVELGNALVRRGALDEADAAFREASALAPSEPEPYFGLATVAERRGDAAAHEQALSTFERLTTERDQRIDAARRIAESLREAGDHLGGGRFAEAAAAFRALQSEPLVAGAGWERRAVALGLARSLAASGELAAARQTLEARLADVPRDGAAALELGTLLASAGLVDEAFPHLLTAVDAEPLASQPHAALAMAWAALGRLDDALAESAKASLIDPDDLALRQQYVDLLAATGRVAEARSLAERGGVRPPADASALARRGP